MGVVCIYKDRYRLLRKLGEGGSSSAYMAQDMSTGGLVTVKKIKRDTYGGREREMEMLSMLEHPAIPKLLATFEDAIVIEYIPGNSLDKYINYKKGLSEKEAVLIALEVLEILSYLHGLEKPVIYRDLKPSNIIIKPDGHVALIDFGAARVYDTKANEDRLNLGTSGFAAPEQYGKHGQTDHRTDIFCFGKTLNQILRYVPSKELMEVINKCIREKREERYGSCKEVIAALEAYRHKSIFNIFGIMARLAAAALIITLIISFAMIL